jgi:hypothetical protein
MHREDTEMTADMRGPAEAGRCNVRGLVVVMAVLLAGPLAVPVLAGELRSPVVSSCDQAGLRRLSDSVVLVLRGVTPEEAVPWVRAVVRGGEHEVDEAARGAVRQRGASVLPAQMRARLDLLDLPPPAAG